MASLSVSVAMATFNGGAYLDQQLSDLATQSVLPTELVVCDDGSTDDTLIILERFAASAPFAVSIHRNAERLGYRANFVKCAGLCRSDLVAFCDQDDRWMAEKIETMLTCFDDADVLLAFHGAEIIAHDQRKLGKLTSTPLPNGASPPLSGSPWTFALGFTQVFRRWLCDCDRWWSLSLDHNSTDEPLAHDQWYFFLASTLGTIVNVEAPLVRYRQHESNLFGWPTVRPKFFTRIVKRIRAASWSPAARAQAAEQRALILDLAADRLSPPFDQRACNAAAAYRRLAELCERRAMIHAGPRAAERLTALLELAHARGYVGDAWAFGLNALALDTLVGVPGLQRRDTVAASKSPSLRAE